jgi:hypothetical protein
MIIPDVFEMKTKAFNPSGINLKIKANGAKIAEIR